MTVPMNTALKVENKINQSTSKYNNNWLILGILVSDIDLLNVLFLTCKLNFSAIYIAKNIQLRLKESAMIQVFNEMNDFVQPFNLTLFWRHNSDNFLKNAGDFPCFAQIEYYSSDRVLIAQIEYYLVDHLVQDLIYICIIQLYTIL